LQRRRSAGNRFQIASDRHVVVIESARRWRRCPIASGGAHAIARIERAPGLDVAKHSHASRAESKM
jgi:hypothetical protein